MGAKHRKKYDKEKMETLCVVRLKAANTAICRKRKEQLKGLTWADVIYRGLGLKRGKRGV